MWASACEGACAGADAGDPGARRSRATWSPAPARATGATGDRAQRGMTIVELMVVVAIIAIAAGLSFSMLRSDQAGSDARRVAGFMSTAYRLALGGGTVRSDVSSSGLPPCNTTARTQLRFSMVQGVNLVAVWKMVEDPLPAHTCAWVYVTGVYLSDEVRVYAVTDTPVLAPTGTNPTQWNGTPPPEIIKSYFPDGTADPMTVYIENVYGNGNRYRVVGLPLAPPPQIFIDW
ncbi:MAG TPA: prepilin-type N-terminal cleavage/methylation domain-containing protein [Haliangiales bacterium]|nr:prepilin-type N-terminal cleavage/methylation domain-containing protein [Haliangiales bacterium]